MATGLNKVLGQLHQALAPGGGLSDGQLLGRHHDAEDAFQATFLVLARKARSLRARESVGCWLHGVARRVAAPARRAASS